MTIYRNQIYLAWIRRQPCMICCKSPCEAHHEDCIGAKGVGLKTHDTQCLPLCPECHRKRHQNGLTALLKSAPCVDIKKEIIRNLTNYMIEKGIR